MIGNRSKDAVRLYSKSAACRYARDGIRVNSVHPGYMVPMSASGDVRDQRLAAAGAGQDPLGRHGESIDATYAILLLASDKASYITGAEFVVDGGFTAQ